MTEIEHCICGSEIWKCVCGEPRCYRCDPGVGCPDTSYQRRPSGEDTPTHD